MHKNKHYKSPKFFLSMLFRLKMYIYETAKLKMQFARQESNFLLFEHFKFCLKIEILVCKFITEMDIFKGKLS